jgi:ubiquinone/menaquinone biosynthesis C-methylase UbiE
MSKLVLDVGCGNSFPDTVLQFFPNSETIGIDIKKGKVTLVADGQYLPFRHSIFDGILCSHVLEHMIDDSKGLNEIFRVLKIQGIFSLVVPNDDCHRQIILGFLTDILKKPNLQNQPIHNLLYHTDRGHYREYKWNEIVALVSKTGFKIVSIRFYGILFSVLLYAIFGKKIRQKLDRVEAGKYSHHIEIQAMKSRISVEMEKQKI